MPTRPRPLPYPLGDGSTRIEDCYYCSVPMIAKSPAAKASLSFKGDNGLAYPSLVARGCVAAAALRHLRELNAVVFVPFPLSAAVCGLCTFALNAVHVHAPRSARGDCCVAWRLGDQRRRSF